jgi:cyclic beta-1,2-glucan synthetase
VTATELSEAAGRTAAANQISIANSIGSLRFIGAMDWKQLRRVAQRRRTDLARRPAGDVRRPGFRHPRPLPACHRGRGATQRAQRNGGGTRSHSLAQAAAAQRGTQDRSAHVGYYLIDHGRQSLERAVGCRLSLKSRISRASRHVRLPLYLGPSWCSLYWRQRSCCSAFGGFEPGDWRSGLFALRLVIAASALAVPLVNLLVTLTLPPRALPRMDFSQGIPDSHRTMVIVPTLLANRRTSMTCSKPWRSAISAIAIPICSLPC